MFLFCVCFSLFRLLLIHIPQPLPLLLFISLPFSINCHHHSITPIHLSSSPSFSSTLLSLHPSSFLFFLLPFTPILSSSLHPCPAGIVRVEQKNDTLADMGIYSDGPYEVGDENRQDENLVPVPANSYLGRSMPYETKPGPVLSNSGQLLSNPRQVLLLVLSWIMCQGGSIQTSWPIWDRC